MIGLMIEESCLEVIEQLDAPVQPSHIHIKDSGRCVVFWPAFEKPALSTLAKRVNGVGAYCVGYGVRCWEDEIYVTFLLR